MPDRSFFGRVERELRGQAQGRVLDLGRLGGRDRAPSALDELVAAGERFDSIISIFELSRFPQPLRGARAIEQLLAEEGRFIFLEPTSSPGIADFVQRAVGRPNHDIPAILRSAGFSMSVCNRIVVNTMLPARMYVEGVAFRMPVRAPTQQPANVSERSELAAGARAPASRTPMGCGGAAPEET